MASQASGFCDTCGEQRLLLRERPNHVLHLILTVLTLGLWAIVWFTIWASKASGPARCSVCGTQLHKMFVPGKGMIWRGLNQ